MKKKLIQGIVNIFETGKFNGDYGNVTFIKGDSGELSFGRSQVTLKGGNLFKVVNAYCSKDGIYSAQLSQYLDQLRNKDSSLDFNEDFKSLLRASSKDQAMVDVQDEYFDLLYWNPALNTYSSKGFTTEVALCVVYDSFIHGSFRPIDLGIQYKSEKDWISQYVNKRRNWMLNTSEVLAKTVYRMDTFLSLIKGENYNLDLPISVHGTRVTESMLNAQITPVSSLVQNAVQSVGTEKRILKLTHPLLTGDDVKQVQQKLKDLNYEVDVDGFFGEGTFDCVKSFQESNNLSADGIIGNDTYTALGI